MKLSKFQLYSIQMKYQIFSCLNPVEFHVSFPVHLPKQATKNTAKLGGASERESSYIVANNII